VAVVVRPPAFDRDALEAVSRRLGFRRVVLFGSRVTGSPPPTEESDLDIAVSRSGDAPTSFWESHQALSEIFEGEKLDLVDLDTADPLFRWEIVRGGVLLWGDELDFLEFRAFAYRDFIDSADLRELERTLSAKKLAYVKRALDAAPP
jgi:predicted nucleotidyltransferase